MAVDTVAMAVVMVATAVDTDMVATARGLLMLRPSPATAMAEDTAAMAVDMAMEATVATDTARGLLMLRPSPATVMEATVMAVDTAAMAMVHTAVATMARGLLMPSLRLRPRL